MIMKVGQLRRRRPARLSPEDNDCVPAKWNTVSYKIHDHSIDDLRPATNRLCLLPAQRQRLSSHIVDRKLDLRVTATTHRSGHCDEFPIRWRLSRKKSSGFGAFGSVLRLLNRCDGSFQCLMCKGQTPLHGHRLRTCCTTPPTNTTNGRAHNNNSTTCCTTNLPHRNARAQHLDMSRWDVANFCPLVVNLLYNKL